MPYAALLVTRYKAFSVCGRYVRACVRCICRLSYHVVVGVVYHHVAVHHHVVALALVHGFVYAVPHAEVSPSELTSHHSHIVGLLQKTVVERQVGI